ncbi:monovalent cation/H+ antiporter complex subunit F [Microbacterium amylolyticum]|uniref:Multicomponent Na+:H+ antiporter subunit F n=1 Tax=Microbacterium amylolyticum TaxID=936337 RepID=A0ABS4ZL19_9MICO|nr:monovalent cation/H+ antiporter complex subunit F [Microbacterium amylolyticum]MBP2437693.1 multicomponent Na+:H+ antiporter subunit F [Microbacterium amylolyticum]
MIGIDIGIVLLALACLPAIYRMIVGPTDADRAVAGDLLQFAVVGLLALAGIRIASVYTFDIVLVAAIVGFLSAISLARALTRGKR